MKVLVTAALPYANARLHIGHLRSTYIPADIYARYLRLKGEEVIFICASDEHGSPIAIQAEIEGLTPKEITDKYHALAYEDLTKMGCSFDFYGRTTMPQHYELVQQFFMKLRDKGFIYEQEIEQFYCEKCDRFLPDRYVRGTCPYCGYNYARGDECDVCSRFLRSTDLKDPYCFLCKSKPKLRKSKHWFFALSAFQDYLKKWLEGNKLIPAVVREFSLRWIEEGLHDWCISRDLKWGVPVPFSKDKVLYVWFDAPIGYISSTKAWCEAIGKPNLWEEYWKDPNSKIVHFIGKGIIYHHALFWPAMLKAHGEYNLPTTIISGGHCTLEGRKMSKGEGWVIEIADYLKKFEPDLLRYYLIASSKLEMDSDFSWKTFAEQCNELADTLGNFIHRTLMFIYTNFEGKIPELLKQDDYDKRMLNLIRETHKEYQKLMDKFDFHSAIKLVVKFSSRGNKYLSDKEPWKLIKADFESASTVLNVCSQMIVAIAIWIEPFLPFSAEKLWSYLNLEGRVHEQHIDRAIEGIKAGHRIKRPEPLFKKISLEQLA